MSELKERPVGVEFLTADELEMYNKPVLATMNGTDWVKGVLVIIIDLFVPYGVKLSSGEVKYFTDVKQEQGVNK